MIFLYLIEKQDTKFAKHERCITETIPGAAVSVTVLVFTGNAASTIGIADCILLHVAAMPLWTRFDPATSGTRSAISEIDASIITVPAVRVDITGLALDAAQQAKTIGSPLEADVALVLVKNGKVGAPGRPVSLAEAREANPPVEP